MATITGQGDVVNCYDIIAFDHAGVAKVLVGSSQLLSGAIACARGFNEAARRYTAVVVPHGSIELESEPRSMHVIATPSVPELTERNFCRSPRHATTTRKTLLGWLSHLYGECDRAYLIVYDAAMECLMASGATLPKYGGEDDGLAALELRLSRSETLAVWREAMRKLSGQSQ